MSDRSIFRKEALERFSSPEQLDQLMQIVTLRSWLPIATLGALLGIGLLWSFWGRIPVTTTGRAFLVYRNDHNNELVGVAYFDAREVPQIDPGMKVLMIPDVDTGKQISRGIYGRVKSVATPKVRTLEGIRKSPNLEAKQMLEVLVELKSDLASESSDELSTYNSNLLPLVGMPGIARVTLAEKAPITFVFPFLDTESVIPAKQGR